MPKLGLELTAATADRGAAPPAGIRPSHELQCQDPKGGSQCRAGAYVELRGPEDSSKELAVYTCFFVFFLFCNLCTRVPHLPVQRGRQLTHIHVYAGPYVCIYVHTCPFVYTLLLFFTRMYVCICMYVFGAFFGWSLATDA